MGGGGGIGGVRVAGTPTVFRFEELMGAATAGGVAQGQGGAGPGLTHTSAAGGSKVTPAPLPRMLHSQWNQHRCGWEARCICAASPVAPGFSGSVTSAMEAKRPDCKCLCYSLSSTTLMCSIPPTFRCSGV